MRAFIYRLAWIVILLAVASSFTQADDFVFYNFKKKAVAAGSSFLFRETFDGANACGDGSHTNCDQTTWTCAAVYNLNSSDNVLQGSFSATVDNATGNCYSTVTGHTGGKVYATAIIRPTGNGASHTTDLVIAQDNGTSLGHIRLLWSTDHYNARLSYNAGASNATTCTLTMTPYEKWYVKLEYTPGTGTNGVWGIFAVKDSAGFPGWGSACQTVSNATDTANVGRIKFGIATSFSGLEIDDIRVNNADITYP